MDFTRELDSSSYEKTRLVIIGAGIAGLAAAKTLEDSNFKDYLLLEAQDQIGGRICSIEWNNNWVEAGAQFLHGDQSALGTLAKEHKLLSETESTEGQGIFVCDDGTSIDQRLVDEIDDLVCDTLENCEKYAYRDTELESLDNIGKVLRKNMLTYLRSKNETPIIRRIQEEIFDWMVKFLMIDNSCSTLDDLSTKYWGKFRFVGGPEHLVFEKGYCSLTNLLAERLDRRNLRLNSAVENIEWQRDLKDENLSPVVLSLNNKKRIIADCVIVTSSLGYLKENHRKMFLPVLPFEHFQAIESLGFGLINKIFLDFGKPWWETDTKGIQMLRSRNNDHEINYKTEDRLSSSWIWDLTGFDVLPNHDAVLLGWVGGQGASIVEKLTENEVANDCLYALKTFLKRDNIPHPKRCIRTRWNANKYVRGAYSHIPACCDEPKITPATLAAPIYRTRKNDDRPKQVPVLMFAGEATHEHFYSTTHGAYDTGKTQALNFLHHHIPE
ncbi:spermine oxidase isoform X2 [Venturia canescens]|uniref:spermine oxidase isoform X2 n=1 Tax=Venturia canescens TaxID=32260 RepID=UPI001C9C767A|nr:spermine oxidase-like isoform X2 [Venturia canescens]